jgi:hypothetical protein
MRHYLLEGITGPVLGHLKSRWERARGRLLLDTALVAALALSASWLRR